MINKTYECPSLKDVACPCCGAQDNISWAEENGFKVVRCLECRLLYVNPRPNSNEIDLAVRTGEHSLKTKKINVKSRRIPRKIKNYKNTFTIMFPGIHRSGSPITWVDIGSGYGETLEAISALAPQGSLLIGVEPMKHKAEIARSFGLNIVNAYLTPYQFKADYVSCVDIFSHIPDFNSFLTDVVTNLNSGGELFIETGNLADINLRSDFPGELGLPDHLVFAGEAQLNVYLDKAGFDVVDIRRERVDGILNLIKNIIKLILGRPVTLGVPYTSRYRQIKVRAKLRN